MGLSLGSRMGLPDRNVHGIDLVLCGQGGLGLDLARCFPSRLFVQKGQLGIPGAIKVL